MKRKNKILILSSLSLTISLLFWWILSSFKIKGVDVNSLIYLMVILTLLSLSFIIYSLSIGFLQNLLGENKKNYQKIDVNLLTNEELLSLNNVQNKKLDFGDELSAKEVGKSNKSIVEAILDGKILGWHRLYGLEKVQIKILDLLINVKENNENENDKNKDLKLLNNVTKTFVLYGPPGNGKTELIEGFIPILTWGLEKTTDIEELKKLKQLFVNIEKGIDKDYDVVEDFLKEFVYVNTNVGELVLEKINTIDFTSQKYVGHAESALNDVFNRVKSHDKCLLFIDEFENIVPQRSEDTIGTREGNMTNAFLKFFDSIKKMDNIWFCGATNLFETIDKAVVRPGRIDTKILIDNPNEKGIERMLKTVNPKINVEKVDFEKVSQELIGKSSVEVSHFKKKVLMQKIKTLENVDEVQITLTTDDFLNYYRINYLNVESAIVLRDESIYNLLAQKEFVVNNSMYQDLGIKPFKIELDHVMKDKNGKNVFGILKLNKKIEDINEDLSTAIDRIIIKQAIFSKLLNLNIDFEENQKLNKLIEDRLYEIDEKMINYIPGLLNNEETEYIKEAIKNFKLEKIKKWNEILDFNQIKKDFEYLKTNKSIFY